MLYVWQDPHPHEVADSRLHCRHWAGKIWDRFPINFALLVHDNQVGYLLSHRLQDTLYRLGVENWHPEISISSTQVRKRHEFAQSCAFPRYFFQGHHDPNVYSQVYSTHAEKSLNAPSTTDAFLWITKARRR